VKCRPLHEGRDFRLCRGTITKPAVWGVGNCSGRKMSLGRRPSALVVSFVIEGRPQDTHFCALSYVWIFFLWCIRLLNCGVSHLLDRKRYVDAHKHVMVRTRGIGRFFSRTDQQGHVCSCTFVGAYLLWATDNQTGPTVGRRQIKALKVP